MAFFDRILFGIIAMVIVGSSWSLTGLIMGDAPKRHIDPSLIQLFGAIVAVLGCLPCLFFKAPPSCSGKVLALTFCALILSGVLNFLLLQVMSYAMQHGPNGIVWAIIQTALFFPFLAGVAFHHMPTSWIQWAGLGFLITALVFFASGQDNQRGKGKWLLASFLGLCLSGTNGIIMTEPSYYPEAVKVNSIIRTLATMTGIMLSSIIYNLFHMTPERKVLIRQELRRPILWAYVLSLQFFNLIFAFLFTYPGLDALAAHDLGGIGLPLMYGSCIISFTLCSIFLLKEKLKLVQLIALAFSLIGLIAICMKPA